MSCRTSLRCWNPYLRRAEGHLQITTAPPLQSVQQLALLDVFVKLSQLTIPCHLHQSRIEKSVEVEVDRRTFPFKRAQTPKQCHKMETQVGPLVSFKGQIC